ncbi:ATP-dependent DNA helicase PcrA [Calycomorphotria hydatis]|uniref:DNA 3'-5' helicase n=2 Tax=Calycomorphotria hydatis TaxID=2528027 RepID=A0A517T8T5_9PLAN|nr:ATP-dependent DNA helicase PcrA [Calycomorphotria hydatis]
MANFEDLTAPQRAAVEHVQGPLLVLAGPGSGKTRVITRRIANLIDQGIAPHEILAITFTNKAAAEMAERTAALLAGRARVWVSTFHRFCANLLRTYSTSVGLKPNFSIYDTSDQQQLMKQVTAALKIDSSHYTPSKLLHQIGRAKNAMVTANQYAEQYDERVGDHLQSIVAKVYPAYQEALLQANAVDFDDLLLHVVQLFSENEDLRATLDDHYRYVLVDEYQDTNGAQYAIVRALSKDQPNLCVTGDPDQSIYGWRGARIENILKFERDYPNANVVRLEENFRSTPAILAAADELIAHNVHRKAKTLKPTKPDGPSVKRVYVKDGRVEAQLLAERIVKAVDDDQRPYSDFAILYRVNALSREIETALRRYQIPYQVAAGTAFYDRAEVKDVLAYLKLIANPDDVIAFRRVVNNPKRSIGDTTQKRLLNWAAKNALPPVEACRVAEQVPELSKRAVTAVKKFAALIDKLSDEAEGPVAELMKHVLKESGYAAMLEGNDNEQEMQRLANVEELVTAAAEYDREAGVEGSLEGFLEQTSLSNETDSLEDDAGAVTLMTLHAAKGLEFPVIFITAVEQMLLPHERSLQSHSIKELEEERRLLFVGITRAMEELTLTHVEKRDFRGRPTMAIPSEFLSEMELEVEDHIHIAERPLRSADTGNVYDDWGVDWDDTSPEEESQEVPEVVESSPPPRQPKSISIGGITTGAALLGTDSATSETENDLPLRSGFAIGSQVRHPRYGTGTVVDLDGLARNRRVTVEFDNSATRKTFIAAKAPLQPVGLG